MGPKNVLRVLLTPDCWFRAIKGDKWLSERVNDALDRGCQVRRVSKIEVDLDGIRCMYADTPLFYAIFWVDRVSMEDYGPDMVTMFRFFDAIQRDAPLPRAGSGAKALWESSRSNARN